jgi:hypothetical protein
MDAGRSIVHRSILAIVVLLFHLKERADA